jgi:hypothetical protein
MHPQEPSFISVISDRDLIGWVLFGLFVLIIIGIRSTVSIIKSLARERTRREIAAYIAEGSMTPEQGERLLNAGKTSC